MRNSFVEEGAKSPITSQKEKKKSGVTHHKKWHIFWDQESATCLGHRVTERFLKIYLRVCDIISLIRKMTEKSNTQHSCTVRAKINGLPSSFPNLSWVSKIVLLKSTKSHIAFWGHEAKNQLRDSFASHF